MNATEEVDSLPEVAVDNNNIITSPEDIDEGTLIESTRQGENKLFLVIKKIKEDGKVLLYGCYEESLIHCPDLVISGISYLTFIPVSPTFSEEYKYPTEKKKKRLKEDSINEVIIVRNKCPNDHYYRKNGAIESKIIDIH